MNIEQIIRFLKEEIALAIHEDPNNIDSETNFLAIGISSIQALKIINKIKKKLSIDINPMVILEYKTISEFAKYLDTCLNNVSTV